MSLRAIQPSSLHPIAWTGSDAVFKKIADRIIRVALVVAPLFIAYAKGARWIYGLGIAVSGLAIFELYLRAQIRSPSKVTLTSYALNLQYVPTIMHPNKRHVYDLMTDKKPLHDKITLTTIPPSKLPDIDLNEPSEPRTHLILHKDVFDYTPKGPNHYWADFGDPQPFQYVSDKHFAQEEILAVMHPATFHIDQYLKTQHKNQALHPGQILLVEGAYQYGSIETKDLYGQQFSEANADTLTRACTWTPPNAQHPDNIFVMCAPHAGIRLEDPYDLDDLTEIFTTAYTAFSAIVKKNPEASIHTGNWGCGAFGGNPKVMGILQIAAAHFANVKQLHYYPLAHSEKIHQALDQFATIKRVFKEQQVAITPSAFLKLLADSAEELKLIWGVGNNT